MIAIRMAVLLLCVLVAVGASALTPGQPLPVRILFDNSGSMYPGYSVPGSENHRTRAELGVHYIREYPAFQRWLGDFVARQRELGARTVGMWTFTSNGPFAPSDIAQVHPEVVPNSFNVGAALERFSVPPGQNTYLTETLQTFTRGFTGIVWVITDNIVESTAGQPDADVERFFLMLRDEARIRSVHLYKYPIADEATGQRSALAVYGLLISQEDVPKATLADYDAKFRDSMSALFPERQYRKLKDLNVGPLELRAGLRILLDGRDGGNFKEGQPVRLALDGSIKSNLTQHSVTGARYELALASPFAPQEEARRDFSLQPLSADAFDPVREQIDQAIPPSGTHDIHVGLQSSGPISLTPRGLGWLRMALGRTVVNYTGNVRLTCSDVSLRLERGEVAGIFGIDKANRIFDIQDIRALNDVTPSVVPVTFALQTGLSRTAILLLILSVLAAAAAVAGFALSRKQWFRIAITRGPERIVGLRRLGSHTVMHENRALGSLSRGISGAYAFTPMSGVPGLVITPANGQPDTWDVRFQSGAGCQLEIKPRGRAKQKKQKAPPIAGPPPPVRTATGPASLPKIDRPR
ncbi:MAG TPA: hypothetical protein VI670_25100 [Thermoanaerobaculia bacterium]